MHECVNEHMSIRSHQEKREIPLGPKAVVVMSFIFQVRLDLGKAGMLDHSVCIHVWPLQTCGLSQLSSKVEYLRPSLPLFALMVS